MNLTEIFASLSEGYKSGISGGNYRKIIGALQGINGQFRTFIPTGDRSVNLATVRAALTAFAENTPGANQQQVKDALKRGGIKI